MKLFSYLYKNGAPVKDIALMTGLSGLANALLLAIVNSSTEMIIQDDIQGHYIVLYLIAFVLYVYTQKYALTRMVDAVEEYIQAVKIRIADKIRHSNLIFIKKINTSELYAKLSQESQTVSESAILLILAAQSVTLLAFSLSYLAYVSLMSFLITLLFIATVVYAFIFHESGVSKEIQQTNDKEANFLNGIDQLISGFQETRINKSKRDGLFRAISDISIETKALRKEVNTRQVNTMIFARIAFYALLAVLVFSVPYIQSDDPEEVIIIASTALFIIGPISLLMSAVPTALRSNVALENLDKLEHELDASTTHYADEAAENNAQFANFKSIRLNAITFAYQDDEENPTFSLGPTDLLIKQNELLFIVGDNGSGKSTLLKMLIGLYPAQSGEILLDDTLITTDNLTAYQDLFSCVFSDYHLFDKPYGIETPDVDTVNRLLKLMRLDKKLRYADGTFSTPHLSSGEQKRLALILSILEDKPIYVFDEPAADLDPTFRRFLYENLLPELKDQGKTIIIVSHDEQYFALADRVVKMEGHQLVHSTSHYS